jgi:hypothetical protein
MSETQFTWPLSSLNHRTKYSIRGLISLAPSTMKAIWLWRGGEGLIRSFVIVLLVLALSIGLILPQSVYGLQTTFFFHNNGELSISSNQVQIGPSQVSIQASPSSSSARAFEVTTADPPSGTGTQIELAAQTYVPASGGNPSGYGALAMWFTKPLQTPLTLDGDVNIHAWMSSSDDVGFPGGSLYFFGVADYTPANSQFQVLSSYLSNVCTLCNVFGSSPAEYSAPSGKIHINQHEFQIGDRLGFLAGAASTKQGWKFTVYFDSASWNSRADIPADSALSVPEFGNVTILLTSCALILSVFHRKLRIHSRA